MYLYLHPLARGHTADVYAIELVVFPNAIPITTPASVSLGESEVSLIMPICKMYYKAVFCELCEVVGRLRWVLREAVLYGMWGVVRGVEVELASNFFDFCASQTSAPLVTRYHSNQ